MVPVTNTPPWLVCPPMVFRGVPLCITVTGPGSAISGTGVRASVICTTGILDTNKEVDPGQAMGADAPCMVGLV